MAEVKNSFLKSRMNQDLDDRLVPNGEYRYANNISVGKSEADDIGALQNMLGNELLALTDNSEFIPGTTTPNPNYIPGLECIGSFMDNQNNRIFQFLTDYTDPDPNNIILPTEGNMKITMYDLDSPESYTTLVQGLFLNFAKNKEFRITGVNLIEGLLFWTDNRNQPRKINVSSASNPNYYTTEHQISVAKYAPVDSITLYKKETATVVSGTDDTYVLSNMASLACTIGSVSGTSPGPYTATITTTIVDGFAGFSVGDVIAGTNGSGSFGFGQLIITSLINPTSIIVSSKSTFSAGTISITLKYPSLGGLQPGATVLSVSPTGVQGLTGSDYAIVVSINNTTLTLYQPTTTINNNDILTFLISTMTDKSSVPSWPGDPAFLEDKYVRFSYRFKYDDNEYSLMAPFTQIAYIPKQKGYFIAGNETDAYRSTIINWFENNINNIELIIPLPDKIGNLTNSYKIKEIDILYKESDSLVIRVFETLAISSINTIANTNNNYYIQPYQSQKPYKALPEDQNIRVYDKVPVRAKAQESSGNRIIYGNYYDKYTCPSSINYNISVQPKSPVGANFIEYPNHTLKKNRNYQVGFVLADKFGRQSPVILSSVDLLGAVVDGIYTKGSTVYSSYENSVLFENVRTWFGDTLILYLNSPIDQQKDVSAGEPGLYAIPTSNSGFAITASTITDISYTYTLDTTAETNTQPVVGDILRGYYTDYVEVIPPPPPPYTPPVAPIYEVFTSGRVNDIYKYVDQGGEVKDIKFSYEYNPIGWYSYKIVVKQQEEDYYNVYLPGMLNGYPKNQTYGSQVVYSTSGGTTTPALQNGINVTQFPVSETGNTAHIVLINDNINKVPRDLSVVGPDQKQYRSSIQLYGRVENMEDTITIIGDVPAYSAKVIKIYYTIGSPPSTLNEDWALIKPGDGIQCEEANAPITITPVPPATGGTTPSPYRWLGDAVVVSNVVAGTSGTITLSSPNWVLKAGAGSTVDYKTFRITRAENKQYFPTRKADTVISIATANEFNFLDNSVDNLSGTAALNFYQLQNSPLIGRVSTVNKIGVVASDMIPFLSVYETKPEQTALELFWETATTGLISDLNADVLTGFDGPSSFGEVNYIHFENQDPYGNGEGTGEVDSKWITDEFAVLNQNGIILPNTTVTLLSVFDSTGQSRLDDFELESITTGLETTYRLYIKRPGPPDNAGNFVFNNNAGTLESYIFTFNVVDIDNPSTSTNLTINGRLRNNNPIITTSVDDYSITQATTNITTLTAVNGSYSNAVTGLKWSITGGDTTPSSFNIHPYTGLLTLTNDQIPLGIYELDIKVEDAVDTNNGETLAPEDTIFGTLSSTITLTINVGDEPVPYLLRPLFGPSTFVYGGTECNPRTNPYGMIYIGKRTNFATNPANPYGYLPEIPSSARNYQVVNNVEVVNANSQSILPPIVPFGLITGTYRVKITLRVPLSLPCNPEEFFVTTSASFSIYLYRRVYNASNSGGAGWTLVETQNNTLNSTPTGPNYTSPILTVSTGQDEKLITTSFTIKSDPIIDYEWAIGVKVIRASPPPSDNDKGNGAFVYFEGEDANYSYDQITPNFTTPLLLPYTYYTGVERVDGSTSAIPYTTLDATRGVSYSSLNNPIASGVINAGNLIVNLTLSTANPQATEGLNATIIKSGSMVGFGKIVSVGTINPAQITIQLDSTFPAVPSLSGGTLELTAINANPAAIGVLYANTIEGTELKRFYTDAGFTQKWIPPFADKYYVFQTVKNYAPNKPTKFSDYPYYCARFNSDGEVIEQTPYTPNSQTAWKGGASPTTTFFNYGYNMYYEEPPLP
jgi:hypothetical protein